MKKLMLFLLVACFVFIVGCSLGRGLLNGLTGGQGDNTAQAIQESSQALIHDIKEGKLDLARFQALLTLVEKYTKESEANKPDWWELIGTIIGLSAGTYLGTCKIRQTLFPLK